MSIRTFLTASAVLTLVAAMPTAVDAQSCPYSVTFTPMNVTSTLNGFYAAFTPATCSGALYFQCACQPPFQCWDLAVNCTDFYVVASIQQVSWSIPGWGTLLVAPDMIFSLGSTSAMPYTLPASPSLSGTVLYIQGASSGFVFWMGFGPIPFSELLQAYQVTIT